MRIQRWAAKVLVATLVASGFVVADLYSADPAEASAVTVACRSTDGTGATLMTDPTKNGYFEGNGIRITPVFSKRMYVDISRGFDATYIAYRVTNISGSTLNNLTIELTDFQGSVVMPATDADTFFRIGTLANNSAKTAYFLIRATAASDANHRHNVRVNIDDGINAKTQRTACYNDIQGVNRSLSASANKVTSISTPQTAPALGSTFDVTVIGAPGKVGAGENPDGSIIALSPASYSSWPSKAIRLENVDITIRGIQSANAGTACEAGTRDGLIQSGKDVEEGTYTSSSKVFTVSNRLVLRGFANCATNTKQTYETKYTFRVIAASATNPVIKPLASISSGTQIKYTGTLPSAETVIPIKEIVYPINVLKSWVSSAKHPATGTATHVDVTYKITASTTSTGVTLNFEEFRDDPPGGLSASGVLQSAKFTDNTRTNQTISKIDSTIDNQLLWRFIPSPAFAITSSKPAVLEYVVRYPVPASGTTVDYTNLGYIMQSGIKVGSSGLTTGIKIVVEDDGDSTPSTVSDKVPQRITFPQPPSVGLNSSTVITATADSTLPVSFSSDTPGVCSVAEQSGVWYLYAIQETNVANNVKCTIRASQIGDSRFAAATDATRDITILRGQVITATSQSFQGNGTAQITVSATSKLPVTLVSLDTDVCTVAITTSHDSGTGISVWTATSKSTGACILIATQPGDSTWGPAPEREIKIGAGTSQTLRFLNPSNVAQEDARTEFASGTTSFSVVTTSLVTSTISNATPTKAGLPVSLRSLTPLQCRVEYTTSADGLISSGFASGTGNTTLTVSVLAAGTCTIEASQDGLNDDGTVSTYAPATEVTKSYLVRAAGTTAQLLAFEAITTKTYGDAGFIARVTSRKQDTTLTNLLVQISTSTPDVCEVGSSSISSGISLATVYLKSAGDCQLTGTQPGDNTYLAASTTTSFTVNKKVLTVTGLSVSTRAYDGTKAASLSGTPALSGVVPGDSVDEVRLSGTATVAEFTAADVRSEQLQVSGLSLDGTKSTTSYELQALTLTGEITQRVIVVSFVDLTVASTPEVVCLEKISVTTGSLVANQSITSITCDLPNYGTGYSNQIYTVTPSSAVIKSGGSGGTDQSSNYDIRYQSGQMTVSTKELATLTAPIIEVVYGELTSLLSGAQASATTSDADTTKVKAKRSNNTLIPGQIRHKQAGSTLNSELPVGEHQVTVEFVPDDQTNYATVSTERTIKVTKRPVRVFGLQAIDKEYDGTTNVTFDQRSVLLAPITGDSASGVLSGDASAVELAGSATGEFTSPDVGSSVGVDVSGFSLSGSKATNYNLQQLTGLTARISARAITVSFLDATVGITPEVNCLEKISISSGSLAFGQELTSISCDLPTYSSGYTANETYTVTPELAVIKQGGSSGTTRTSNYIITYRSGVMTITSKEVAEISAADIELVYGELLSSLESEATTNSADTTKVKARGKNNTLIPGQVRHKKNGQNLASELGVGEHTIEVEFVPDSQYVKEYATATTTRKIKILPRPIRVSGLQALNKEYDGTRSANFSGALSLTSVSGVAASGVIAGDSSTDVDLDGAATGEFDSQNAGEAIPVSVAGLSLKGTKAANYALQNVTGLTARITKKPLKLLVVKEYAKLKGDPDPLFAATADPLKNFVQGESLSTIGGATVSRASGQSAEVPGTPITLEIAPGNAPGKNNYEVELATGVLHISDVEIVVENDEEGSPSTVTCACANLKEGQVVTLTMYSDPTVIATTTVTNGTCPFAPQLPLPDAEGNHTLELTSQFPNGEDLTQSLPITFMSAGSGTPPVAFSPGSSSLLPPTLLITKSKFKSAEASWLPATGSVSGYQLFIDGKLVGSYGPNVRSARIPGLSRDTLYRATLVAIDGNNQSAFSQADFWTRNKKRIVVYFSGDSPIITATERQRLRSLVRSLPANYQAEMTVVATVKRIPGRSFASNKQLADARATNVTALLKRLGLKASFSVVGVGVPESDRNKSRKAASKLEYVRIL